MGAESWASLRFQQSQIRVGDRVDLDHASAREPNRMRQLYLAAHTRPFRAVEVGEVGVDAGSRGKVCAADDVTVLHAPLDLAAPIVAPFRFAVRYRAGTWIFLTRTNIGGPDGN